MSKQTVIPAGYRITVESWENDADNYKTKIMEGLQKASVEFLVDFVELFHSQNNYRGPKGHGNMYDPDVNKLNNFREAYVEVIKKHITKDTEPKLLEYFWDEDNNLMYDDSHDGVMELAYELGLSGGAFYARVLDSIKVEYIPNEIVLQDVTEEFV